MSTPEHSTTGPGAPRPAPDAPAPLVAVGEEAVPPLAVPGRSDAQRRADARARTAATLGDARHRMVILLRVIGGRARRAAARRRTAAVTARAVRRPVRERRRPPSPFWSASPASVADLLAYTRSGAWVPGERALVLEAAGKAYGYLVAVPTSVALYAVAWLLQRPARLLLAVVVRLSI